MPPTPDLNFACSLPRQILFGDGRRAALGSVASRLGRKALLVTGKSSLRASGRLAEIRDILERSGVGCHTVAIAGEPSTAEIDSASADSAARDIDLVIAVGGGAVLDAGKAIAAMVRVGGSVRRFLEKVGTEEHPGTTLPVIALPTTAGTGSEATKNAVISEVGPDGFKASLRHDNFVPACAIVDPELQSSCPRAVTAACALDAFTQLLEAYVSTQATPFTDALAWSGLEHACPALSRLAEGAEVSAEDRRAMAYAATLSGIVLANAGLGVIHGIAGALGAHSTIPHGVACGTLLAGATRATIAQLWESAGARSPAIIKYAHLGGLLGSNARGTESACKVLLETLDRWTVQLGMPVLADYGLRHADSHTLASESGSKNNPVALTIDQIAALIESRMR